MSGWINSRRVAKINALITTQIEARIEQAMLLRELKKAVAKRMVRGELRKEDLLYIRTKLEELK